MMNSMSDKMQIAHYTIIWKVCFWMKNESVQTIFNKAEEQQAEQSRKNEGNWVESLPWRNIV